MAHNVWHPALFATGGHQPDAKSQTAETGTHGSPGAEAGLARLCWLLTLCEDVYRSGLVDDRLARLFDSGLPNVDQLRGLIEQRQVDELVALARQLHERGTLWKLRKLAGDPEIGVPLGIAGPTIVPHWADADLLIDAIDPGHGIDARGGTLLDVKTVINVRDTAKSRPMALASAVIRLAGHR